MAISDILAGNIIYAEDINLIVGRLPIRARSTSATTFTSTTTFGNVAGLSVPVNPSSVYKVRGRISVTGANTTHDVKLQWSLPASATVSWSVYGGSSAAVTNAINSIDMGAATSTHIRGTFAGTLMLVIDGFITTAGNGGTAQLQAAQNTSDAGTLSIDAGSEINLQLWV